MNSLHQMESFDTNIDCFGGVNQCQRYFSLSRPLFLLSQPRTKKTKINYCTKTKFKNN